MTEPWDRAGYKAAVRGQKLYTNVVVKGVPLRVFSRSFWQGRSRRVVQAAYPLAEVNRVLAWLNAALLALIPLMLVASATGGAFLTDRALRPVRQVAHAAARIGAHDLAERLPVVGNDEFWELAVTFNGMLGRLQGSFAEKQRLVDRLEKLVEQERRFTADASHELRTPLAIIKANSSLALSAQQPVEEYQKSLEEIDQAANSMARLVQDLLLLARSDAGQLGRAWTALSIRNIVSRAAARVRSEDRILNLTPAALRVPGSEGEILRLFTNLLENASRYTPAGGTITVSAQEEGTSVHVSVADTGTGIAPEHLAHLGERFYRVDASRSRPDGGTGLGLSICKSIVEAHGGSMHFESKEGSGTTVHVLLPAGAEEQQSDSPDGRN